jgi:hypothetical protein
MTKAPPARLTVRTASGWEVFWFQPIPPHLYALLRVVFGVCGCAILVGLADTAFWDLDGFVATARGWSGPKELALAHGLGGIAGRLLWAASLVVFACMTVGLWSRATVPLSFAAALAYHGWTDLPLSGADDALRVFLFCLIWTDSGAVWSVDAWRDHRRHPGTTPRGTAELAIAPLRLLRFQLAIIYLSAGLWKLHSPLWRDGSAVHYVVNTNVYHRFQDALPPALDWIATTATYVTLFWELGFALMVLWPPTRTVALVMGVLVHLGMFATIEVGPFHLVMLSGYLAFLDPFRVSRFAGFARRR